MDSRDVSESILEALNDIDDKYISHARSIRPKRMVSLRSVLIAAVVVALAVVSAMAVYSSKSYSYETANQSPTDDPVTSVTNLLRNRSDLSYVINLEIYGAEIDEEETARVLSEETELVDEREWNEDNFVVVYAEYYEVYYHAISHNTDGYLANWYWMEYDEVNDLWVLYYNSDIDSDYQCTYLGFFNVDGVGYDGWCKDDVESYQAAMEYFDEFSSEDYVEEFELLGCVLDYDKTAAAMNENYANKYGRVWYNSENIRIYNFVVYYAEFYAEYDESLTDRESGYQSVWLLIEESLTTAGEWSCYEADTDEMFEYVFVTYSEVSETASTPEAYVVSAALTWLINSNFEDGNQIIIYGAKVDYTETRQVIESNRYNNFLRGWSWDEKNFLVVRAEFRVNNTDKIYYIWLEKDSDTGEWEYYFSVDMTKGWNEWEFK